MYYLLIYFFFFSIHIFYSFLNDGMRVQVADVFDMDSQLIEMVSTRSSG